MANLTLKQSCNVSSLLNHSAFSIVSDLHSKESLRHSSVFLHQTDHNANKKSFFQSNPHPLASVDTAPKALSSFLRHKMRKLTKLDSAYVRKLMAMDLIKTSSPLNKNAVVRTEEGLTKCQTQPLSHRPQTSTPALHSSVLRLSTPRWTKPIFRHSVSKGKTPRKRLNDSFERVISTCERSKLTTSSTFADTDKSQRLEKSMTRSFFGTVDLISEIDCRKLRHLPEIYFAKISSNAINLQDAQEIETEYRQGISDPSRFVGKLERKRWGRQKIKPQYRI